MKDLKKDEFQKCKTCKFTKAVEKYWEQEYMVKKATIITQTVATTLSIIAVIISISRLLLK